MTRRVGPSLQRHTEFSWEAAESPLGIPRMFSPNFRGQGLACDPGLL